VPSHLRDTSYRGAKSLGHGAGYEYPHDHEHDELGGWVDQEYLPEALRGQRWYRPSRHGHEQEVEERMSVRPKDDDGNGKGVR
jgi:putative ATPase